MVAAGHPATVAAASEILAAGGNAVDACVAAGFAAAVAEPCLSSLGGGGFLLSAPADAPARLIDFFVDTPGRGHVDGPPPTLTPVSLAFGSAEQVFHVGYASVAVPGCLPGYLHASAQHGRLPLAEVIAPARTLARDGVVLGADQAAVVRLLRPIFEREPTARALFAPEDRPFGDEELVRYPALATFLDRIADGEVTGFAADGLAEMVAEEHARGGGLLTAEDLRAYQVVEREPLVRTFGSAQLLTNPEPSFGGRLVCAALERLWPGLAGKEPGTPERLVRLAAVLAAVSDDHTRAAPAATLPAPAPSPAPPPRSARGTTHVSVVDADGNLAAMTTSNGSGSGITLSDTGVLLNNIMGETDLHPGGFHRHPPGERVGSMMAPSVLRRADGTAVALGSGGSERIRSALTQVLLALLVDGESLAKAVLGPRIHVDGDGIVQIEPGVAPAAVAALAEWWPVNPWPVTDLYFGGVHAVSTAGDAVGDPRRGGCSARLPVDGSR